MKCNRRLFECSVLPKKSIISSFAQHFAGIRAKVLASDKLFRYTNNKGYQMIHLRAKNKSKLYSIHRLVAEAFIENPNNYPQINHKDEDKTNNCVSNLEWCTCKYNNNYGAKKERLREALKRYYKKQ